MKPRIRTLRPEEVPLVVEFAAREGWNPGLDDASAFHAADPEGFLGAELDGEIVGVVSAVRYAEAFGFLGCYVVAPAFRGRGIGLALWRAAMDRLADVPVGLDGVVAQQANYRRSGFELAWNNARYAGRAGGAVDGAVAGVGVGSPILRPLADVPFAQLEADDRRVFPAPRPAFWRAWLAMPGARGLAWVEDGRLRGWGVIRACRVGHKVAPLVAESPEVAGVVFDGLAALVPAGDEVFLDVPVPNAAAVELAEARGMAVVFETARMYANGPAPRIELDRVFGVTSFELG